MRANQRIKTRRLELGLSDVEVAGLSGITVHQYFDVELHADEFASTLTLAEARSLCKVLGLDFIELATSEIDFLESFRTERPLQSQARGLLIASQRSKLKMSRLEMAEKMGFTEKTIEEMEGAQDFLESWSINLIVRLARTLHLPPLLLLD